jgi:hypothetical protein
MRRWFVLSILVFVVPAFILLAYSPLALAQSVSPIPPDAQAAMGELQKEPFRAHMAFLADDLLEGRGTGARGHEIAARYLASQFEAIGLKPAGQGGAYFQRVPLRQLTVEPEKCAVSITENGSTTQLKWGDDFLMRGNEVYPDSSIEAPVVFVGYSVRTPDGSYDDYSGVGSHFECVRCRFPGWLIGRGTLEVTFLAVDLLDPPDWARVTLHGSWRPVRSQFPTC